MKSTNNLPSKVTVTQEHIANGSKSDCGHCPVALALLEATGADRVFVGYGAINTHNGDKVTCFMWPRSVTRFVDKFDEGRPVKPFTFKLRPRI